MDATSARKAEPLLDQADASVLYCPFSEATSTAPAMAAVCTLYSFLISSLD